MSDIFTPDARSCIDRATETARSAFTEVDYDVVTTTAGYSSDYGRSVAQYNGLTKGITFCISNEFAAVKKTKNGIHPKKEAYFESIVLHELAHHIEHSINENEYKHIRTNRNSTHGRPSWVYVTTALFKAVNPRTVLTAEILAHAIKQNLVAVNDVVQILNRPTPPTFKAANIKKLKTAFESSQLKTCKYCDTEFKPTRSTALFCSANCRVRENRAAKAMV